jgi:hypothetical protein
MDDPKLKEVIKLAHAIADGRSANHASKADWYHAITKAAEAHRQSQESPQQAFTRFVTTNVDGRAMFAAYASAGGADYSPPVPVPTPVVKANDAHARLSDIAAGYAANPKLTRYDALSKAYASHPDLATLAKRGQAAA